MRKLSAYLYHSVADECRVSVSRQEEEVSNVDRSGYEGVSLPVAWGRPVSGDAIRLGHYRNTLYLIIEQRKLADRYGNNN